MAKLRSFFRRVIFPALVYFGVPLICAALALPLVTDLFGIGIRRQQQTHFTTPKYSNAAQKCGLSTPSRDSILRDNPKYAVVDREFRVIFDLYNDALPSEYRSSGVDDLTDIICLSFIEDPAGNVGGCKDHTYSIDVWIVDAHSLQNIADKRFGAVQDGNCSGPKVDNRRIAQPSRIIDWIKEVQK